MFNARKITSFITAAAMAVSFFTFSPVLADEQFESAADAVGRIGAGWNLGNTLDSYGTWITAGPGNSQAYETAWQNPVTTQAMIDSVRDKGFNAIRIPVTWSQHIDSNGHVDQGWMNRVKEVVDMAYNDGLYVILNVHHDTGEGGGDKVSWIFADNSNYDQNQNKFAGLWTEIANEFKEYGTRLLFEGYNEMMDTANTWEAPSNSSSYQAVNNYAQLFVNTVRATGGNNAERNLIVNTYVSSFNQSVLDSFTVPTDSADGHLICEIHCYSPWGFTGTSQSVTWTSVHNDFGQQDKDEIDGIMSRLASFSSSRNIPLIIGEYGAEFKNNEDQIALYVSYFVGAAGQKGIKCFYWDNGDFKTSGEGGYAIFNRSALSWKDQIADAIVSAAAPYTSESAPEQATPTPTPEPEETTAETSAAAETSVQTEETAQTTETVPAAPETPKEEKDSSFNLVPFIAVDAVLAVAAACLVVYYLKAKKERK